MKRSRIIALVLLMLGGCGRVADLEPASGHALPVKPAMAKEAPTAAELLSPPSYTRPVRIDDLIRRSEPRAQDPFNLPPPTGGAAPSLPAGSQSEPATNQSGVVPPGE
jgi:hypothetical protein